MVDYKEIIDRISFQPITNPKVYNPAYKPKKIVELEEALGKAIPDDLKYCLLTYGSSSIDDNGYTVRDGDAIMALRVKYFTPEYSIMNDWKETTERLPKGVFKGDPRLYLPIISGDIYEYLMDFNEDGYGAIHAIRNLYKNKSPNTDLSKEIFEDIYVAPSLTVFMQMLGPYWDLSSKANAVQRELFARYWGRYEANPENTPTTTDSPEELMRMAFEDRKNFKLDGVGSILGRLNFFKNYESFEKTVNWYRDEAINHKINPLPQLKRQNIYFGNIAAIKFQDGLYEFSVSSTLEPQLTMTETFLLRKTKGEKTGFFKKAVDNWMLIRRSNSTIEDIKINGLGTLFYTDKDHWSLKRRTKPAWSPLTASLFIVVMEDGLTKELLDVAKDLMKRQDLNAIFETYIFNLYTTDIYPDYLAFDKDERDENKDLFPTVNKPGEIWEKLIKKLQLYITRKGDIIMVVDTCYDEDHQLTLGLFGKEIKKTKIDDLIWDGVS